MAQIKFIRIRDDKSKPAKLLGTIPNSRIPAKPMGDSRSWEKPGSALDKIHSLFRREKRREQKEFEYYLNLVTREPGNTFARLRLADIYQKRGEKKKAILEYLQTAEVFSKKRLYPQAIAIYKRLQRQDPALFPLYPKFAEICRKMGFQEETSSQLHLGVTREKKPMAQGAIGQTAESKPQNMIAEEKFQGSREMGKVQEERGGKGISTQIPGVVFPAQEKEEVLFDLGAELEVSEPIECKEFEVVTTEKSYGFEEILRELKGTNGLSKAYPNFNYNMGVACREMGFIDEAIEQLHIASEAGQKPFEAAYLLGLCFVEKEQANEARQSFEKALKVDGISKERIMKVELALISMEKKKGREDSRVPEGENEVETKRCECPLVPRIKRRNTRNWAAV